MDKSTLCCKSCAISTSESEDCGDTLLRHENEHLKREIITLNKLISELENVNKLQCVRLQELEAAETVSKLSSPPEKQGTLPSYSGALKKAINTQNPAVLIIKALDTSASVSSSDIMKDITKSVNPAHINVCINGTRKIRDGVAVRCDNMTSLNKLKDQLNTKLGPKYAINEPKKFNPRIIIKNVRSEGLATDEDLIENILFLNELDNYEHSCCKIITKLKYFNNCNIVLEVDPSLRKLILSKGYLFIGWQKCMVDDHIRILRCFKCSGYGHLENKCLSKTPFCPNCSGEHILKNCDSEMKKCANCTTHNNRFKRNLDVNHSAKDSCCQIFQNYFENLKGKIRYE